MKKVYQFIFIFLGILFTVPPGFSVSMLGLRSKMPCNVRKAEGCRDPKVYQRDKKDGCATLKSNCIKQFCMANCMSSNCDQQLCQDCKNVFLGGTFQQNLQQCVPAAIGSIQEYGTAIQTEEAEKLARRQTRGILRAQGGAFKRDLQDYETEMIEYNQVAARFREAQRLLKKYEQQYQTLKSKTGDMYNSLLAKYGSDAVRRHRIDEIKKAYEIHMNDLDSLGPDRGTWRRAKGTAGRFKRGAQYYGQRTYDPNTRLEDVSPASNPQNSGSSDLIVFEDNSSTSHSASSISNGDKYDVFRDIANQ